MGKLTLSKLQMQQYREIKKMFANDTMIAIDNADHTRLKEVLMLLSHMEYIAPFDIGNTNAYSKIGNFDDFEAWHDDMRREERKLSTREWKIAVVCAFIGLIPFLIATVIPWIISLFKEMPK